MCISGVTVRWTRMWLRMWVWWNLRLRWIVWCSSTRARERRKWCMLKWVLEGGLGLSVSMSHHVELRVCSPGLMLLLLCDCRFRRTHSLWTFWHRTTPICRMEACVEGRRLRVVLCTGIGIRRSRDAAAGRRRGTMLKGADRARADRFATRPR